MMPCFILLYFLNIPAPALVNVNRIDRVQLIYNTKGRSELTFVDGTYVDIYLTPQELLQKINRECK